MTRRLPPLYALRAFEAAARHASFTRAGEELAITQSAVSRHIRTLEELFGCRLFERHGRQLRLTEPARLLLPGLRDGFDALERACTALRVDDATLRLKAPSTLTLRWLLPRLSRFRHLNPDIEVQLTSAWMDVDSVDFQREPFDCAVLLGSGQFSPEWETAALFAEWLVPVCEPDEAVEPWTLQRLRDSELLHPTPDRRDWRRWLQRTGLGDEVSLKGGQVFDTLELGIVAAA
ncbi:TPA: LysR family transcriptional regulator, partial [Pseudomonas aeruginosa]